MNLEQRAHELLCVAYGPSARFRTGQVQAIRSALVAGGRTLVVQRTGWGKSVVYFLATRILREMGCGPTLLVSPLLALMRNQIQTAARFGVRAISINSTNPEEWADIERAVLADEVDLLLIAPERLSNERYKQLLMPHWEASAGLLVIDEAHCISDWGHDFRPDYRRILPTVKRLPASARILGTTATANDRVISDIRTQLGESLVVQRGPLMRESLAIEVHELADQAERLAWLAQELPHMPGSGIVYTLTVNDARRVAEWLQSRGINAEPYHADVHHSVRVQLEERFLGNGLKCLVATTALGMGYDKSDVAFVVHFQRPGSIISYYQQIGRAGRSLERARVALLTGIEDDDIAQYFIRSAFPGANCFSEVLQALRTSPRKTVGAVTAETNHPQGQVEKALKLLEVEEVIVKDRQGYRLLCDGWQFASLRSEAITGLRLQELEQMRNLIEHAGCRMEFIARALDDPWPQACGQCDRCTSQPPITVPRDSVVRAVAFLRGDHPTIASKTYYPAGVKEPGGRRIPAEVRVSQGLALCVYNDAGWGRLVREGKYRDNAFSDELVRASADLIDSQGIEPAWLTWVPSRGRPTLVSGFARRLAQALGIEAIEAVRKVADNPEQKAMQNSTRQYLNIHDAFKAEAFLVRPGTCLLVDDVVDSGWTVTTIGILLRTAGCENVVPYTLAVAKAKE